MSIIACDYSSSLFVKRYYHLFQTRRLHSTTVALHTECLPSFRVLQKAHVKPQSRFIVNSVVQPCVPPPSGPPSDFLTWMLGAMAFVLPLFTGKWGSLLRFKNEADTALQSVEDVVEAIEKVADMIDKAAEKLGKDLPEGGRSRRAVDFIRHVAETTSREAHLLDTFIDTVQEAEEKVEEYVEAIAEEAANGHPKSENGAHEPIDLGIIKDHGTAEEESHEPSKEAQNQDKQS